MKHIKSPTPKWLKDGYVKETDYRAVAIIVGAIVLMVLYMAVVSTLFGPQPIY